MITSMYNIQLMEMLLRLTAGVLRRHSMTDSLLQSLKDAMYNTKWWSIYYRLNEPSKGLGRKKY